MPCLVEQNQQHMSQGAAWSYHTCVPGIRTNVISSNRQLGAQQEYSYYIYVDMMPRMVMPNQNTVGV